MGGEKRIEIGRRGRRLKRVGGGITEKERRRRESSEEGSRQGRRIRKKRIKERIKDVNYRGQ